MKRRPVAGGKAAFGEAGSLAQATPLAFPSADGPGASRQATRASEHAPVVAPSHAWPLTPALIAAPFAVAAFAVAFQSVLAPDGDAAARFHAAAWTALVTLVIAAVAGWLLGRHLNRPVQELRGRAEALALRYSGQTPVRSRNAMHNLEMSFEAMSAALLAHCDRLKSLHLEELQNSLELQRRYALMRVLRNVAIAALECEHLEQVLERTVEEVGGYLDWPIGRVLIVGEAGSRNPAARSVWFMTESERFATFVSDAEAQGAEYCPHGPIGLAGSTGMPHWVTDLDSLPRWTRHEVAVRSGLKTGFVIPIAGDGSTHAFLEFFSDHRVEASPEMIELIEAIHVELWQAGQWRRDRLKSGQARNVAFRSPGCSPEPEALAAGAGVRA